MTVPSHGLGGRLALLDPKSLTGAGKATYDAIDKTMVPWAVKAGFEAKTSDGRLIGPFNSILLSPEITNSFLALQAVEQKHTTLSDRVRQIVILTVGAVWACDYERYAHSAVARKAGISDAAIKALVDDAPAPDLDEKEQCAQRFTRRLTVQHQIDDDLYAETEAAFGPQGIVDIIYLAGCYHTVSALLNAFRVPAPE